MKYLCLQSVAARWFSFIGGVIGKNPQYFIMFPILITITLSYGMFNLKFNRDMNKLFTAVNGRAVDQLRLVENLFESNTSFATVARQTKVYNMAMVEVLPRDEGTIFRKSVFNELNDLDNLIRTFNTTWERAILNYRMICGKVFGECVKNNVLELASYITDHGIKKHAIKYPIDMKSLTFSFKQYLFSLGSIEVDDEGYLVDAKAIRLSYMFDIGNSSKRGAIEHWLRSVNRLLDSVSYANLKYIAANYIKAEGELEVMTWKMFTFLPVVVSSIAIFAFISCMTDNLIRSKPLVGVSSCISAGLATVSGFSLCLNLGFPFTDCHLILAFSILAIEVDDAFILIASWRKTNTRDNVTKRMRQTFSAAGVSVTITSITNMISFCIGIFTPFPLIKYISIYSAATIFFSYVYLLTFFGGCLALDGYREEKGRHPIFLCDTDAEKPQPLCKKGIEEEFFMRKFRVVLGDALNCPFVKVIVVIVFLINLTVGIWGLKFLVCGNDYYDMLSDNSELAEAVKWHYKHFKFYSFPIHIIIDYPINYADPKVQTSIDELMKKLEAHPHIADASLRISWMKYYKLFANSMAARFSLGGYNMSNKEDFIDGLHHVFLNIHTAKEFKEDIIFNENFTDIVASRFLIPTKDVTSPAIELQIKDYVYSIVDQSPLKVRAFCGSFHLIEQAQLIKDVTLMTAVVSSALILLLFFLFVPNVSCAFIISSIIICMFCETVGYMSLWNVKLDMSALVTLIVSIGFSINYPTHISFSYVNAQNMCPENRVRTALYEVGMPIFQGSVSTLLGIMCMGFQNYYSIRAIAKIVLIITLQTAFHSLFFILVMLSTFGRCDQRLSIRKEPVGEKEVDMCKLGQTDEEEE